MILLLAVVAGLLSGMLRTRLAGRGYLVPDLRLMWLVPTAFTPQFLVFGLPSVRSAVPDSLVSSTLISSQILLLIFAWSNRNQPGFWLLALGLAFNLAVIAANGGFMPISPETAIRLAPEAQPGDWQLGERLGASKDLLLPESSTLLRWLSDRFSLPDWVPYRVAFSLGDMFIAGGVFWFFTAGAEKPQALSQLIQGE